MAPRTAKGKKAADVKAADSEGSKQTGKGKNIEEPVITTDEVEDIDNVLVTDKKAKRGKRKAANGTSDQIEDNIKETAPPSKKGKKEKVKEVSDETNNTPEVESTDANNQNGDGLETNGDVEEASSAPAGRGRNKAKKETNKASETKSGRSKRNPKPEKVNDEPEQDAKVIDKPASKKGRGRKVQSSDEAKPEDEEKSENVKTDKLPAKGRKKATKPVPKEKTPEIEEDENLEEENIAEPIKKEAKSRKNRGKKAKGEVNEVEDKDEEAEKKDEEGQGDSKDDDAENAEIETKPSKGKRAAKKKIVGASVVEEPQDTGEPKKKKRAPSEEAKVVPPKNKTSTEFEKVDFKNSSRNSQDKEWNFKIASWNVDGIRAWLSKGGLDYIKYEKPDILCLQEIKCSKEKLPSEITNLPGYHAYWLCSEKDGYAGVGVYTTKLAMNVQYGLQNEELDSEGRIITAEYEHFYLICTYVPNAGRNLVTLPKRLQWNEEFRKFVKELDKKKPVIICGDMNVAHNEIDLANPKTNKKNAGFTVEERTGMTDLLGDGFVDTYRHFYPDKTGAYTFWTYMKNCRTKNIGWRLDYFIVSERLMPLLCDSTIREGVYGSDHCPISLFLHLSSAVKLE